jgi:CHAT domain-containing protein
MNRFPKTFAVAALVLLAACRGDSPADRMRALAPRAGRTIEARLTGFGWSPMRVQRASRAAAPLEPARLELAGAAGAVIENSPGGHDAGVGYLVIDRDADAVDALQEAALKSPNDAKIWSDLAAARYTLAVRGNHAYELPRALAAADRALRIDANRAEALFNRALILERLGIADAARRAWHRALEADSTSKWADEALEHLGRLSVVTSDAQFRRELERATAAMRAGDAVPLGSLARTRPQEARKWGEGPLLAEWADAIRAEDHARAKSALDIVRAIGRALAESNQERLLADAVSAIDEASTNPQRLRIIAEAQASYRDGRIMYSRLRIAESQQLLRRAAGLLKTARSPMEFSARYYLANTFYDDNRADEAAAMLRELLTEIDASRYRALHAHIKWELSLCQMAAGAWESAIDTVDAASRTFGALGETFNRANTDLLLASALDHVAQPRAAWTVRVRAFADLSRGEAGRIAAALPDAIRAEAQQGQYDNAVALSNLSIADMQSEREAPALAMARINRSRLLVDAGDLASAHDALREAREATARIGDGALRTRVNVYLEIADAASDRAADPAKALASLNAALQFFAARKERGALPDVYLQRGRTYLRARNEDAALADFEAGIREIDALRAAFDRSQLRSEFYDTASELFVETISLLLRRNEVERAFAVADGARARTLSEQLGGAGEPSGTASMAAIGATVGPDAAVIEYAVLRDSLAIFYLSRAGAGVEVVPINAGALRRAVEHSNDLLQRRGDAAVARRELAALDRILIAPVLPLLRGVRRLAIIPDGHLSAVPFNALYDAATQRYRIEDFVIGIAPSARFLIRTPAVQTLTPALVVGDPTSEAGPALPEAAHEAEVIASLYPSATLLVGDVATRARFVEAAAGSGMIHYAGHAQSNATTSYGALPFATDDARTTGELDAGEIAGLRLRRAPLVVLAACGTIRGDANHVEGMPSVARAFLAAGARGVIGTLWEIDDDIAARVFRSLHNHLRAGNAPADALRNAQLELLRATDNRLQHPASWAPIEILGHSH